MRKAVDSGTAVALPLATFTFPLDQPLHDIMTTDLHAIETVHSTSHGKNQHKSEINGFICHFTQPGAALTYTGVCAYNFKKLRSATTTTVTDSLGYRLTDLLGYHLNSGENVKS